MNRKVVSIIFVFGCFCSVHTATWLDAVETAADSLFVEQEEPPFTAVNTTEAYEVRKYESINWVCGKQTPLTKVAENEHQTFLDLLGYLQHENALEVEIPMSTPVAIWYSSKLGQTTASLKACFYINSAHQANPPAPTNANLTLFKSPPMTIYTRQVDGNFKRPLPWLREAKALLDVLTADGIKVKLGNMIWNAYDPPFQLFGRRNEVWFRTQ